MRARRAETEDTGPVVQAAEKLRLGQVWEGHDFSRAVKSFNTNRASAPACWFRHQQQVLQQPAQ